MASTSATSKPEDGSNFRKRKREVKQLLALESKRKKFAPHGTSSAELESSSAASSPSADNEVERVRLQYIFDKLDRGVIFERLKSAITLGNKDVIDSLAKVFDKSAFPPQSTLTCARCEASFDPNYNTTSSCKMRHQEIDRIYKSRNGSTWQCYACNTTWESDDCCDFFGVDIGFCFTGPHTAIEYELDRDYEDEDDLEDVKRKKYW